MRRPVAATLAIVLTGLMAAVPPTFGATVTQDDSHDVLIEIGGDASVNACAQSGAVVDAGKDGAVVRRGPSEDYGLLDQLVDGTSVFVCATEGSWLAVVYGSGDCGVSEPWPEKKTYNGPCLSGWLPASRVKIIAG
ncbi:integron [Acuticoccus kandeliae]|uniref:integron n=1 Tax=Acuticoccus kandeliae TaxID=2073160 RepID=UPI000D3E97A5|nr:integron [Acuticoccus kandeliae]